MTPFNPHVVPRRTYLLVWLALLLLLVLNWGLAQLPLGPFNLVATLVIALAQMLLMVLYMMHVRYESPLARVAVVAGCIWFAILVDLTLSDYLTRGGVPGTLRRSWEHGAWPAPVKQLPNPIPGQSSATDQ